MREKRINWFLIVFAIISIPIFYSISENSAMIQGNLIKGRDKKVPKVIYDLNTALKNHMISKMKTYELKSVQISKKDAESYAKKLGIDTIKETNLEFRGQSQQNQLIISRNLGIIQYNNLNKNTSDLSNKITSEKAGESIIDFMENIGLDCSHKKSLIEDIPQENRYRVRFINTVEGILNYGYCAKADISYSGEILGLECHKATYKPRTVVSIKPAKKAYKELIKLPIDKEYVQIDIKKVDLVYYLNNDNTKERLLVPAYRFFGEVNNGDSFEYFVSAVE
ncbi:MAG: hypothetical protein GX308_01060 [Epulopiscium sp.]|mgnify:CR=1 FL=1|nr:hypothetical protein [Candidatus Epulonipiscium sp.]